MFKIIKETKFLWISISMLFLVVLTFSTMEYIWEITREDAQAHQVFTRFSMVGSLGLIAIYWVTVQLYPRITDFILEKEKYKLPEVKSVIKKLIVFFYILLAIAIGSYLYLSNEPIYYSLVELVMIFSLFVGFITLLIMFSKGKHQIPYGKERMINLIAFILFIGSVYLGRRLNISLLSIKIPFFGIFASILMNIDVYKRIYQDRIFK